MKDNFILKRLTIEDYDLILRLWADTGLQHKPQGRDSRESIAKEMNQSFCAYFGLFDNDQLIACGIANYDGRRGWVNRVSVAVDYRGKRIAARIIEACEQFLKECGAVVICALIGNENLPSMATFEHSGYTCEPDFVYWTKRRSPID